MLPLLKLGHMEIEYQTEDIVKVARDAAGYVASYINSGNRLPVVLSLPETRQRKTFLLSWIWNR